MVVAVFFIIYVYLYFVNKATSRVKKPSLAARSPFNERAVRVTAKPHIVDKQLYYWVLSTADKNK